jgi:hypothetical protein
MATGSDTEIVVKLTADQAQLQAGMEQGAASVKASTEQMQATIAEEAAAFNAAVQAKIDAQVRLNAAFAGGITSTEGLAEAETALDQAMNLGAVSAAQYTGYVGTLDAAEVSLTGATEASTAAINENTVAIEVNAVSSRTAAELGVLLSEAASGNFSRMKRSIAALGNSTGVLQAAFTGYGPAILGATAAVIAFGVAAVKGAEEQAKFEGAILMTGDAAGVTAGDFEAMAERVGESSGSFGKAKDAMIAIVESGKFAADQIQLVGIASQDMAQLTGQSVDQAVNAFIKLQEKPVEAVVALNDKYHFLTTAVFDQIQALQQQGETQEAAKVATEAYSASLQQRTDEIESHLGALARAWNSVKSSASFAWDAMLNIGKSDTLTDKIGDAQSALEKFQSMGMANFNEKAGHVGWEATGEGKNDSAVAFEIANLKKLQAEQEKQQAAAKKSASDAANVQQYTQDAEALDKWNSKLKDNENLQAQIAAKKAQVERVHKEDPNSAALKGYTFDASGAVTGGEEWDATIKKLTKEYGNVGHAARDAATKAKKAAAEAMNALEMVRAGTAANTAERIQADASILASATRLYGANSSQQKFALAQMLSDEKAYDAAVIQADNERAQKLTQQTVSSAQSQLAVEKEKIATSYALHQSSQQQEIAQLAAANDAEYALELQAYQKQLSLLDLTAKARQQINTEIEKLQQKHELEMQKISDDAAKANQQMWEKRLNPISQAFNTSINGMIQGTQTLRQSLANIGDSILAKYAQLGIDMLVKWVANEAAKTTATAVGTGERQVIEQTAATQSKITDAATGKSQITSAAATGAAKAYQAIVGIPFVGPVLAPIAAGVAFAGIEAFSGMISSAQGGWERVPADGMMTELHKNEMVLPAPVADHVRNSMGGKAGGGMTVNLSSTDPRGFKDYLRRNPGALSDALKHANRRGHFAGVR